MLTAWFHLTKVRELLVMLCSDACNLVTEYSTVNEREWICLQRRGEFLM